MSKIVCDDNCFLKNGGDKCTCSMDSSNFNFQIFTDDSLDYWLKYYERLLKDGVRSTLTEEQVESHIQNILREQHRRKMFYCFDEIRSIGIFKEYKRKWVIKWLDGICLEKIRPLWSYKEFKLSEEE